MSGTVTGPGTPPAEESVAGEHAVGGRTLPQRLVAGTKAFFARMSSGPVIYSYFVILGCVLVLTAVGLMMVLSASAVESISENRSAFSYFSRQATFAVLGLVAMVVLSMVPTDWYKKSAWALFGMGVLLLCLVFTPLGMEVDGNKNWILVGGQSFQPSEAAKLSAAIWLGMVLGRQQARITSWATALWPSILGFVVPVGFVALGRDIGTALVFVAIYAAALFFAGAPLRIFAVGGIVAAVAGAGTVVVAPHRMDRIRSWLLGDCSGQFNDCWQADQGILALSSGGWWGMGLGQSRQKYNYVPEAHNDYIFSIIGEELGLMGSLLIILVFVVLALSMGRIMLLTKDPFVRITTAGILAWIVGQAFINIGMVTGVLPVIGVPLPFISYGGSALLMCLCAMGVVMSFARVQRIRRRGPVTFSRELTEDELS